MQQRCPSVCLSVAWNKYLSSTGLTGPPAQYCWRPWPAGALLGQSGQCMTYWRWWGLTASDICAALTCYRYYRQHNDKLNKDVLSINTIHQRHRPLIAAAAAAAAAAELTGKWRDVKIVMPQRDARHKQPHQTVKVFPATWSSKQLITTVTLTQFPRNHLHKVLQLHQQNQFNLFSSNSFTDTDIEYI